MARTNTILAAEVDFNAYRNDTFSIFIDFFDDQGAPFDLTVFDNLEMQIRNYFNDKTALVTLSLGSGLTVTDTNRLTILIDAIDMDITNQSVVYDIEGENVTERKTILRGNMLILPDVTRV